MDDRRITRLSKYLARHLRHDPGRIGITLDRQGWTDVADLLAACARHNVPLSRAQLDAIVARNDKQRFALSEDGTRIRANQGHTVEVDLGLEPAEPPEVLYHGTVGRSLAAIRAEGLRPMNRHHVHLSPDRETATRVGARRGRPVILTVAAGALHRAGHPFYRTANNVWLTEAVPPRYLG
ncbi:RNA 2'-phosphotransferase [Streptomyces sp. YIM 98790]|uniref:RNA 2'-phosphotransferase n=1 Tax=Streptomyces sp. YIM 98790 TaxID=2689077 RepID=UPI001407FE91|nr:RNA 2'-phosphotransferase [Streptomyces sp. YIM 98790]